jgi:hypothetical protein
MEHLAQPMIRFRLRICGRKEILKISLYTALDIYLRGYRVLQSKNESETVLLGQCAMTILGGILGESRLNQVLMLPEKEQKKELQQLLKVCTERYFKRTIKAVRKWEKEYIKQFHSIL